MNLAWIDWQPAGITFGLTDDRPRCIWPDCDTILSRFNDGALCGVHEPSRRSPW